MCLIGPEPRTAPETGRFQGFTSRTQPADSSDLEESEWGGALELPQICQNQKLMHGSNKCTKHSYLAFKVIIISGEFNDILIHL